MASLYYDTLFTFDPLTQDVHDARDEVWLFVCPDEILEMALLYYETLFTMDPLTLDVHDARDEIWSFVCPMVSKDMNIAIMCPFSLQEVRDAVHGLDGASCPGDDGLILLCFKQYWDLISQPLQEGLQGIFDKGLGLRRKQGSLRHLKLLDGGVQVHVDKELDEVNIHGSIWHYSKGFERQSLPLHRLVENSNKSVQQLKEALLQFFSSDLG
ncbi:hypothetical protein L7F22_058460 [Adiantum nelumboides]|nr:hypothetical protein [Adiantum nelumboides]